ncbi:MAG: pilus assembly protein TadG-related protein [Ilumatobacteraceae bacterium]
MRRTLHDRGSVVLLVAAVIVLAGLMAIGVSRLGVAADERARAQTAADAAALAGVSGGRPAASRLAGANGGDLVSFERSGWAVTVVVEVGGARATARATNGP